MLQGVLSILQEGFHSTALDMFASTIPALPPSQSVDQVMSQYGNVASIDNIISERWKQVRNDFETRRRSLVAQSKWLKKVRAQGMCVILARKPRSHNPAHFILFIPRLPLLQRLWM